MNIGVQLAGSQLYHTIHLNITSFQSYIIWIFNCPPVTVFKFIVSRKNKLISECIPVSYTHLSKLSTLLLLQQKIFQVNYPFPQPIFTKINRP